MFQKILVAYDGSETAKIALDKAISLKQVFTQATLEVVHVFQIANLVISDTIVTGPAPVQAELYQASEAIVEQARQRISHLPFSTATLLDGGAPAPVILDYADEHQFDLVVIGSRGMGALKELVLGSVSHEIVQRANIPVLVVK
ncbi:universal stress protein [Paenibacillus xerothermodurans]|uniref:universal stress protein n=1 Tax=Paenibacillus xerothermodurans TaxID=1977292 RepID=UPI001403EE53|nr:universal stress protein [Paenibacillus xerothermodurans]